MSKSSTRGGPGLPPPQMQGSVRAALAARGLTDAFRARPKYQQDDYLTWINGAKLNEQKRARTNQMLDELEKGGLFKGEPWTPPAPVAQATKAE